MSISFFFKSTLGVAQSDAKECDRALVQSSLLSMRRFFYSKKKDIINFFFECIGVAQSDAKECDRARL